MDKFIHIEDILINLKQIMYVETNLDTNELEVTMNDGKIFRFDTKQFDIFTSILRILGSERQE